MLNARPQVAGKRKSLGVKPYFYFAYSAINRQMTIWLIHRSHLIKLQGLHQYQYQLTGKLLVQFFRIKNESLFMAFVFTYEKQVFQSSNRLIIATLLYFIMRITAMQNIVIHRKNKSLDGGYENQKPSLSVKTNTKYQLNALLTFKKPSKIGKKELLQMLSKKNTTLQGTFTVENSKILLITETKQVQKPATSFRKKYVKTIIKKNQNLTHSNPSVKEEINISSERKNTNFDFLKKYFNKSHLFDDQSTSSQEVNHLKGLKLTINDKYLKELNLKEGEDWRLKRLQKQKGKVQFINNFVRTRYKTVHNDKQVFGNNGSINPTNSLIILGTYSERRSNGLFSPWDKKEQYDQFQI